VEQYAEGFEEEDDFGSQENLQLSKNRVADEVMSVEEPIVIPGQPVLGTDHPAWSVDCDSGKGDSPL
ncbi:hypothetical protein A2U01_0119166, partial [Trifolium medium]|nr:hypothetical protein [Trifolium medium]